MMRGTVAWSPPRPRARTCQSPPSAPRPHLPKPPSAPRPQAPADAGKGPSVSRRTVIAGATALGLGAVGLTALRSCHSAPQAASPTPAEKPETATLLMVGDVLPANEAVNAATQPDGSFDFSPMFANIREAVEEADIAILNQETILGGTAYPYVSHDPTGFTQFDSPQELGDAEVEAGFDVALKGNNHVLDQGMEGLSAELAYWREKHPEIVIAGAADNQEDYDAIPMVDANGIKIAILSYTYGVNLDANIPDDHTVHLLDEDLIRADVKKARKAGADIVLAAPHWGIEFEHDPSDQERSYASVFADAGADVIIGGHPHVIQPVEVIDGKDGNKVPVFWSLGNYLSFYRYPQAALGGMAHVTFEKTSEGARVSSWAFDALVMNMGSGDDNTVYFLRDYTADMAAANQINLYYPYLTLEYLQNLAAQVLGEGYDAEKCRVSGEL